MNTERLSVAFVCYRRLPNGYSVAVSEGWHGYARIFGGSRLAGEHSVVAAELADFHAELARRKGEFNRVVLYIGGLGFASEVIKIAQIWPAEQVTFLMCPCDPERVSARLAKAGLASARVIPCMCGGGPEFLRYYKHFCKSGVLADAIPPIPVAHPLERAFIA